MGKIAGVSHTVIQDYKRRVVLPAIQSAQKLQSFQPLDRPDSVRAVEQAGLTKDIVRASPFRDRLEKLHGRIENALDRAETSVRVVRDKDTGELVPVGPDVAAIAPIMNQAHKNLELLGRVTGELEAPAAANVAIQIVMPSIAPASAEAGCGGSTAGSAVIDIAMPKR